MNGIVVCRSVISILSLFVYLKTNRHEYITKHLLNGVKIVTKENIFQEIEKAEALTKERKKSGLQKRESGRNLERAIHQMQEICQVMQRIVGIRRNRNDKSCMTVS